MPSIDVRELQSKASEIVRNLRQQRTGYMITDHGQPIALRTPLEEPDILDRGSQVETSAIWADLTRLGQEIARGWPANKTSGDNLTEMRR